MPEYVRTQKLVTFAHASMATEAVIVKVSDLRVICCYLPYLGTTSIRVKHIIFSKSITKQINNNVNRNLDNRGSAF